MTDQRPATRLDPDPLHVEPEAVRRGPTLADQEDIDGGRLVAVLAMIALGFAVAFWLSLMLSAPRGAPNVTSPLPTSTGRSELPGAPSIPAGAPGDVAIAGPLWAGTATWYCSATSACTHGYGPSDLVAAIDTDLGIPKGALVTVRFARNAVTVRIVDVCACAGERLIDLTSGAFRRLAPLSAGVLPVTLEVVGSGPLPTLPNTDTLP